ncbi:retrovirus-related pol polyprotein from transposon TNT 1-94 [Tanacetum coccineum]
MSFIKRVENQNDIHVKQVRTDNGTEFRNSILVNFYDERGISQNFASPYTPEQNGVAERRNRNLIEVARTMLSGSVLRLPNISFLHVFGCPIYIHNYKDHLGKFEMMMVTFLVTHLYPKPSGSSTLEDNKLKKLSTKRGEERTRRDESVRERREAVGTSTDEVFEMREEAHRLGRGVVPSEAYDGDLEDLFLLLTSASGLCVEDWWAGFCVGSGWILGVWLIQSSELRIDWDRCEGGGYSLFEWARRFLRLGGTLSGVALMLEVLPSCRKYLGDDAGSDEFDEYGDGDERVRRDGIMSKPHLGRGEEGRERQERMKGKEKGKRKGRGREEKRKRGVG